MNVANRASALEKAWMVLLSVLVALSTAVFFAPQLGYADEALNWDSPDYHKGLVDDKEKWDEGVITKVEGYKGAGEPKDVVAIFTDFSTTIGSWIVTLGLLMATARLAWRALLEMAIRQGREETHIPVFLQTGEERASGRCTTEWVLPMFKETFLYLGLAIFVFLILSLIAAIVLNALAVFGESVPS